MVLDHGAPVESLAFLGAGALLVSAGGTSLCVWDMLGGGKLLRRLSNFQKTVTSVSLAPAAGPVSCAAAPRLLAGSLDGHVKVFELDAWRVTAASRYPAPVTGVSISADAGALAVGMADGTLCVRRHARPRAAQAAGIGGGGSGRATRRTPRLTAANFRFFLRGRNAKAGAADTVIAARRRVHLAPYDRSLRAFRYRDALDAALATREPGVVHSMLDELAARGGLQAALAGRGPVQLLPLLHHITRHIADPRHSSSLAGVIARLLELYAPVVHTSAEVDAALTKLCDALREEVRLQETLMRLSGCLEPILSAAFAASEGVATS